MFNYNLFFELLAKPSPPPLANSPPHLQTVTHPCRKLFHSYQELVKPTEFEAALPQPARDINISQAGEGLDAAAHVVRGAGR